MWCLLIISYTLNFILYFTGLYFDPETPDYKRPFALQLNCTHPIYSGYHPLTHKLKGLTDKTSRWILISLKNAETLFHSLII